MPLDPEARAQVRVARDRAIARLSEGFAKDDLELDELERRVTLAHRADSVAALGELTADLPVVTDERPAPSVALVPAGEVREEQTVVAVLGGVERKGTWTCPRRLKVVTVLGGAKLDFREARLSPGVTQVVVRTVLGGCEIRVPPGLAVEVEGVAILGGFEQLARSPADPDPAAPLLRITGLAVLGGVEIETRLPGETSFGAWKRKLEERFSHRVERRARRAERKRLRHGDP